MSTSDHAVGSIPFNSRNLTASVTVNDGKYVFNTGGDRAVL